MKTFNKKARYAFLLGFAVAFLSLASKGQVYAAYPVSINEVDYENENIIVNNNGNAKIYFATENDASRGSWETMLSDVGNTSEIDFSWVSPTTEQTIVIKGEDGTQRRVTLRERTRKLEVSISYDRIGTLTKTDSIASLLNIMSSAGTGETPINFNDLEWRKGENGSWKDTDFLTVEQLEKLQIKGANLYFRIKAKNDITGRDGTNGRRVSKEVRLKITKKASPSAVRIDGEDFTADIRYGKEYRVTHNGVTSNWVKVTDRSTRDIPLSVILNVASYGYTPETKFPEMVIETRSYATARAAASKISEVYIKEQRELQGVIKKEEAPKGADSSDNNIYLTYNGASNIAITIPSASMDNPYQYTIIENKLVSVVEPIEKLNLGEILEKVSWTNITRSSAVKILATRATEGSVIIIRQKEIKAKANDPVILASTCLAELIRYPAVPSVEKKNFTFVKGLSDDLTFRIDLNTPGVLPFEKKIKSIKLGTKELTFGTTTNVTDSLDPGTEYYINVTISKDFLNNLPNSYSRVVYITFENGTLDRNSIKLSIQSPTPAAKLSASLVKGKTAGTTKVQLLSNVLASNKLVYTVTIDEIKDLHTEYEVTSEASQYTPGDEITASVNQYVTIYEINPTTRKVIRYKSMEITSFNHAS